MNCKTNTSHDGRDHARICYSVRLTRMETGVELIVNVADALPLGLKVHAGERDATLKRLMKQSGTAQIQRGSKIQLCTYPPQEIERLLANPEIIAAWRQGDFEQF